MFFKDSNNNRYYVGRPFFYNNTAYPKSAATAERMTALGFTKVEVGVRPNSTYYIVSGPDNDGLYSAEPRNLETLKSQFKLEQKAYARQELESSDWYVIRLFEQNVAIPTAVTDYRTAYRTAADTRCAEIDACTTVGELETLMEGANGTEWPVPLASTYSLEYDDEEESN